ncbi:MAG: MBL fold metallo-hydrolase [Deltaproteobacteria bacterium]|nr:MBL fold metallo-hydrolase [Deltaproteobacteria bacterium]
MLVRSTGPLAEDFLLLTLGRSCHYLIGTPDNFYLFDPGLSVHVPMLLKRLNDHQYSLKQCAGVLLTHLHSDRIGGVPYIKQLHPEIPIIASSHLKMKLGQAAELQAIYESDLALSSKFALSHELKKIPPVDYAKLFTIDRTLSDSEQAALTDEISLRALSFPGHARDSLAYLIEPYNFLIVDEGVGYFNGREPPAPGFDDSIESGLNSLRKLLDVELRGLCMPNSGVLTAQLIRKHLSAVVQQTQDILSESRRAFGAGVTESEISAAILHSFYQSFAPDPLLSFNLQRSFEKFWQQILTTKGSISGD